MWCHIVDSDETCIQRLLPSPKVALDNHTLTQPPPLPPEKREKTNFTKFCAERGRNHLQCVKQNVQSLLFCISMCHTKGAFSISI